jgi:hypothetical protein
MASTLVNTRESEHDANKQRNTRGMTSSPSNLRAVGAASRDDKGNISIRARSR